jgi:hypothetical protein
MCRAGTDCALRMTDPTSWFAVLGTIAILCGYEGVLLLVQRRNPARLARSAHADLREQWYVAISRHPGSEILAVQTLRNSLMSATMTASTAVLGLIGTASMAVPSLRSSAGTGAPFPSVMSAQLVLELVLMAILFASLACSATAVRYYNHAGFISAMPVGSTERERWSAVGITYLRRAGLLYSWGLRYLLMVAPLLAAMVYPPAGPVASVLIVAALVGFDRFGSMS